MAVHNLSAPDVTVGWKRIDTLPHDGNYYEVMDAEGHVGRARVSRDGYLELSVAMTSEPTHWRKPREE